ncbi:hypothetical protein JXQ70_10805 [bacterium]|nr:hypothetical protein [bacterium]
MSYYRPFSCLMCIIFIVVGFIFLFFSESVLVFFNTIASRAGMQQAPIQGIDFYLVLAVGYMYLVSLLAYLMHAHPGNATFPMLLTNAKLASSVMSLAFFIVHRPYPIYLTNCIVDGVIGLLTLYFYLQIRKTQT